MDSTKTPTAPASPARLAQALEEVEAQAKTEVEVFVMKIKLDEIKALHARWRTTDKQAPNLQDEDSEVVACKKQRCRDVGLIIFGFE